MQEPPYAPQGPSPYAAPPPPRRGPSTLACCLGCIGVAFVLIVALGAITYFKVSRGAGPQVTAANYRSLLPADVPLYPGMRLDEKTTNALRFATGAISLIPKASGASLRMMAFDTDKDLSVIGPWYKKQLTARGYTLRSEETRTRTTGPGGGRTSHSYSFRKGTTDVFVAQGDQNQRRTIILGVGKNLPADMKWQNP